MSRSEQSPAHERVEGPESLSRLLGGRRAGIDASVPPVGFGVVWLLSDRSVGWAAVGAIGAALAIAAYRLYRSHQPRAVLVGLLGVSVAALIALYTGRAADFFLLQVASNIASALVWTCSLVLRWPLLGVIVGTLLRQRTTWRRDLQLRRAYAWASLVWVAQYLIRVGVFGGFYLADHVIALSAARFLLSWPLVAVCVVTSAWVFKVTLPSDHPGMRHPQAPQTTNQDGRDAHENGVFPQTRPQPESDD